MSFGQNLHPSCTGSCHVTKIWGSHLQYFRFYVFPCGSYLSATSWVTWGPGASAVAVLWGPSRPCSGPGEERGRALSGCVPGPAMLGRAAEQAPGRRATIAVLRTNPRWRALTRRAGSSGSLAASSSTWHCVHSTGAMAALGRPASCQQWRQLAEKHSQMPLGQPLVTAGGKLNITKTQRPWVDFYNFCAKFGHLRLEVTTTNLCSGNLINKTLCLLQLHRQLKLWQSIFFFVTRPFVSHSQVFIRNYTGSNAGPETESIDI